MYYCYLLESEPSHLTYAGYTGDPPKRIRQHNSEIAGGAKSTKRGQPWHYVCHISGFKTKTHALQFEYAIKHCTKINPAVLITSKSRNKHINKRVAKLFTMLMCEKASKRAPLNCDQQYTITWFTDRYQELDHLVPNVTCVRELPT